jgi:uncharacterized protein DUF3455
MRLTNRARMFEYRSAPRRALRRAAVAASLLACAALSHAQGVVPPEVPDAIKAPAGERVVLRARASGVQIYVCGTDSDGKPNWSLKAPDAQLRDDKGALIGHHGAGPSWKHSDGSEVSGKAAAKVDSPDPGSIPWLLVAVTGHSGTGVFGAVSHVQRVNTVGGQAPPAATCNPARQKGKEARVPYRADYYFYTGG